MIRETHDYFQLHTPSGRAFMAEIPSLLSAEDHDWLMLLVSLLRYEAPPEKDKTGETWADHIEGTLPADDLRRAFVMGAKWWEWHDKGATMFGSDVRLAEEKAEECFPGGKVPKIE